MFRVAQWSDSHKHEESVRSTQSLLPTIPQLDLPIHCGDVTYDHYTNGIGGFNQTISTCVIGNHDAISDAGIQYYPYRWDLQQTQRELYNRYFEGMSTKFGLDMARDTTWWSKEFTNKRVLFLGLNDTVVGDDFTDELNWVNERVKYAEQNNLMIAAAKHGPTTTCNLIKCNFTSTYMASASFTSDKIEYSNDYGENGEKLMAPIVGSKCRVLYILAGHEHGDGFGYIVRGDGSKIPYVFVGATLPDKYNDTSRGSSGVTSNVVCNMIDYVPDVDSLRIYRLGADSTYNGTTRKMLTFSYGENRIVSSCGVRN